MKNQDNDFNSSLFPDSVVDRNKGSNLFSKDGEDDKLIGEELGSEQNFAESLDSAFKLTSQISSPPQNPRLQGPPGEHMRTSEITEFNLEKTDSGPPLSLMGAHESLVKTDQQIAQDLEDKVIAVSDLDEMDIEEDNSNAIETIVEAEDEDYDDEDSIKDFNRSTQKSPKQCQNKNSKKKLGKT